MPLDELRGEIAAGVCFWGLFGGSGDEGDGAASSESGMLAGVMGIQDVDDVTLIRHAYVRPERQRGGVGTRLLEHLVRLADEPPVRPVLVGTWAAAWWAWASTSATASSSSRGPRRTVCSAATGASRSARSDDVRGAGAPASGPGRHCA